MHENQVIENRQDNILTAELQEEIEDIDELDEMNETIKIYKEKKEPTLDAAKQLAALEVIEVRGYSLSVEAVCFFVKFFTKTVT